MLPENMMSVLGRVSDEARKMLQHWPFWPTVFLTFVLGMLLLLFRDLDLFWRHAIVPSLLVLTLGWSLVGFLDFVFGQCDAVRLASDRERVKEENEKSPPDKKKRLPLPKPGPCWRTAIIFVLYVVLLGLFVWFNVRMYPSYSNKPESPRTTQAAAQNPGELSS